MPTLIDVLRDNEAKFEGENIIISCRGISKAFEEYSHQGCVMELEDLLQRHSTQAYWPAIIKERIKQLKGE